VVDSLGAQEAGLADLRNIGSPVFVAASALVSIEQVLTNLENLAGSLSSCLYGLTCWLSGVLFVLFGSREPRCAAVFSHRFVRSHVVSGRVEREFVFVGDGWVM